MSQHFSAFSFVDRIDEIDPGVSARGRFHIPAGLSEFPSSLVAEAIGQLAAWVSMDRLDYAVRPVAGIAGEARFLRLAKPGATLELGVNLVACSETDVAYGGWAAIDGEHVTELDHCLGPMLPMSEFDDPAAVRERYALLRGEGAPPDRFTGVDAIALTVHERQAGLSLVAGLSVPASAPFFGDHFPRRPVFPATLLLDTLIRAAVDLANEGAHWPSETTVAPLRARDVKMRAFISPGQELDVKITLDEPRNDIATARLTASADGKRVAHGRLDLAPRGPMR